MYVQTSLWDTDMPTSSPGSADGRMRSGSQDGRMSGPCGPDPALASLTPSQAKKAGMTMSEQQAPRRRIEMTLKIDADSWGDARDALGYIERLLLQTEADGSTNIEYVGSGLTVGFVLKATEDRTITRGSYFQALRAYNRRGYGQYGDGCQGDDEA